MISKKDKSLVKGLYEHYQPRGYFTVKQYIVVKEKCKRCLLLRFLNEMKGTVSAVEFRINQLDEAGGLLKSTKVKYDDINVPHGQNYCTQEGIVINEDCVDFIVQMIYVVSGKIKYLYKRGTVTAHYDTRGFGAKKLSFEDEVEYRDAHRVTVRKKLSERVAFFKWMAFLSFLIAAAAVYLDVFATFL